VVLHDIGKIHELSYERGFSYSSEGQLLGHMIIALRMVDEKLRGLPEFPPRLRSLVEHMIISHHGQLEFGSPKLPQFPEAMLLHYLDDMDSKIECMRSMLEKDRQVDGCFTGYNSALDRTVLKKDKFLDPSPVVPRQAPPAPAVTVRVTSPEPATPSPAPPVAVPQHAVQHPLFGGAPRSNSPFGDKLLQALQPAENKREG
jgi:3'-5' exoribonuclease